MDEKIKTWTLRFPAKENPDMKKALFDCPIVLQYDVQAKYRLISRSSGAWSFFTRAFAQPTKRHACLCPFDKPIKSLYFRSFVASVLFARFHFKVIRKSPYSPKSQQIKQKHPLNNVENKSTNERKKNKQESRQKPGRVILRILMVCFASLS